LHRKNFLSFAQKILAGDITTRRVSVSF
jgi:hypothetical protein